MFVNRCLRMENNTHDGFSVTESNNESTTDYVGPFAPKNPSKVLGPLVIYQNQESTPKINHDENPYFNEHTSYPKLDVKTKPTKDKTVNFINPTKSDKGNNKKPSILFVTPPPLPSRDENHIPNASEDKTRVPSIPENAVKSEIEIHGHSNPEELLQFINQHPEISNYPSGSVLEVHQIPSSGQKLPSFPKNSTPEIHLVPYLIPTNGANDLPPGFSLKQILQEFHKNTQPQSAVPFVPQSPFSGAPGPVIVPQQHGSLFSNLNGTQKG